MKKLVVLLSGFVLSCGVALASQDSSDCGSDDVKPISLSANQT